MEHLEAWYEAYTSNDEDRHTVFANMIGVERNVAKGICYLIAYKLSKIDVIKYYAEDYQRHSLTFVRDGYAEDVIRIHFVTEDVEDGTELSIWYHVREVDGWVTLTLSGDVLFIDQPSARECAKEKILTSLQKTRERLLKLECMSQGQVNKLDIRRCSFL